MMKKLLLFVALLGLALPLRAQDDKALAAAAAKADLKLMSFNIRYYKPGADGDNGWVARRAACLEMIRAESPDVIGFQEPHRPQIDYLKVNLPECAEVDMGRDAATDIEKKPDGGEHLMIMYRRSKYILLDSGFFWISPTPECPSRGWDAMCRRVTVWVQLKDRKTGKEFFYFDTHFDHIGKQARAESARMMVARMKRIAGEKAAVFLSGDLNTTYDNALLDPLKAWMRRAPCGPGDRRTADVQRLRQAFAVDRLHFRPQRPCAGLPDPCRFRALRRSVPLGSQSRLRALQTLNPPDGRQTRIQPNSDTMKNLSLVFRSLALPVLLLTLNAAGAQEKQPLRYVDAATLTVIGKSMPTPKLFQRVDTARYELWQPVKNYSAFSTGLAVVFRTDSRTIRARWKTGGYGLGHNMTAIARKGLDLYIERDGQWVYAGFRLAQGRQPRQRAGRVYGRGRKDLSGLPAPVGRGGSK